MTSLLYSIYMAELRLTYIHATEEKLEQLRHERFAVWLLNYVSVHVQKISYIFNEIIYHRYDH